MKQQRDQSNCEELSEQSTQQRTSLFYFFPQGDHILNVAYKSGLSPSHAEDSVAELENAQKKTARFMKDTEWVPLKQWVHELKFI